MPPQKKELDVSEKLLEVEDIAGSISFVYVNNAKF
jgi:hypothetical protein